MYTGGDSMDDLSVIIRVRNEERYIGHCIQSILDHLYKPEIIIIDNNSTDLSSMIWGQFKQDPSLQSSDSRYAPIKAKGIDKYTPGKALNMGVEMSTRGNILIISSHCVIKSLELPRIFDNLNKYGALFGRQIPHYYGKRIKPTYIWSHFKEDSEVNPFSELENRLFFHNAFSFFKRDILLDIPFNEELVGKEDRYWASEYVSKGNSYLYDHNSIVDHHYTALGNTWKGIG